MSVYFSHFPKTTHNGQLLTDITRRCELAQSIINDKYAYLPYLIKGDMKPEDVAYYYYGDVRYTWVVYYSTGVLDPYYDWPLNQKQFDTYLINKYATQANTSGYAVISWTQNEAITDNIIHYENENGDKISPDSYTLNSDIVASEWTAVRYYDYEVKLNDDKRSINLLEKSYAKRAEEELNRLLNDGIS